MDILALVGAAAHQVAVAPAAAEAGPTFQINLFWVIVSAANFIVFFLIVRSIAFGGLVKTLDDRRLRIEQGLKDAEQARRDREAAESERLAAISEARREAHDIISRAQKASACSPSSSACSRSSSTPPFRSRRSHPHPGGRPWTSLPSPPR